jgi:dihydropteroate synthase
VRVEELDVTGPREAARHIGRIGGERGAAGESVIRLFEFDGLSRSDGEALADAAEESGATFVPGQDGRAILMGTPVNLMMATGVAVADASADLREALDVVRDAMADQAPGGR